MSATPSRLEDLKSLKAANIDVGFATAFVTLVSGPFLVGFVKHLGGGDVWIGLLSAIPSLAGLLQVPGAIIGRGFSSYKWFVFKGATVWRLAHLPLVVLPFLPIDPVLKLTALSVCLAVGWACSQFVNPIYNDWLAEMVPANSRGWFFSRRSAISAAVGATLGMVGALVLDGFKRGGHDATGYGTVFAIATLCSAASMYYFLKMGDRVRPNPVPVRLKESLGAISRPYQDRSFRRTLAFLGVFVAGQMFAGNLFAAFALESLKMPFSVLQTAAVMHAVGNVAFARMWGFLADKYGNKPVLAILVVGLFLTPVMWLFCGPGFDPWNAVILIPGHIFSGMIWGGIVICQLNLLLAGSPSEDRANYLAAGMTLQAGVGALAPFLGSILMHELRLHMAPDLAYKIVFGSAMAMRLGALWFLFAVREEGSESIMGTLKQLRRVSPGGYRSLRKLTSSTDVDTRESAMADVASRNMDIASDELIKALHDPAPRIRRKAAAALAQLGDSKAVTALVHQLEEHPDLVEGETIEALGHLGGTEAVGALIQYLGSPRPQIRRASARALGRIGGPEATTALLSSAEQDSDPDLRRASLQALRWLEADGVGTVVAKAVLDGHPSVRIAAAELAAELHLTETAPALRETIGAYDDEASSEVAYALGAVGSPEDLPLILNVASKCRSVTTRRRCLLGAARLLGVERETYRIMLLEGIARDNALLEAGRALRSDAAVSDALDLYTAGREADAIRILAAGRQGSKIRPLAEQPVEEAFLVAANAYANT